MTACIHPALTPDWVPRTGTWCMVAFSCIPVTWLGVNQLELIISRKKKNSPPDPAQVAVDLCFVVCWLFSYTCPSLGNLKIGRRSMANTVSEASRSLGKCLKKPPRAAQNRRECLCSLELSMHNSCPVLWRSSVCRLTNARTNVWALLTVCSMHQHRLVLWECGLLRESIEWPHWEMINPVPILFWALPAPGAGLPARQPDGLRRLTASLWGLRDCFPLQCALFGKFQWLLN